MGPQEKLRREVGRRALHAPLEPVAEPATPGRPPARWHRIVSAVLQCALSLAVIAAGYVGYQQIMAGSPVAQRAERPRVARLIETVPARMQTQGPVIGAWGEVMAAQSLTVRPEVSGTLVWVNSELTPGGLLHKGDVIARFDERDLGLAVAEAKAQIAEIEARIRIERGQAEVARGDLSRFARTLTEEQRALVLRQPQMAQLDAELAGARSALERAENQLARAEVRAPFDAVVINDAVEPGAMLSEGSEIAQIVATDRFFVRLAVPASALDWIDVGAEPAVTLRQPAIWPDDAVRTGRVARLGAALSETGRMAELIVDVSDPLALDQANAGRPRLLLGAYVEGSIEGRPIGNAVAIERSWLHEGDTVWVMNAEDLLEIRPVEVAWRGAERVLIAAGLAEGERLVTTPLAIHADGMALRVRASEAGG